MLTDVALKNLKPREKPYKVADRDGMYCKIACNNDPLRGRFASNTDPL